MGDKTPDNRQQVVVKEGGLKVVGDKKTPPKAAPKSKESEETTDVNES